PPRTSAASHTARAPAPDARPAHARTTRTPAPAGPPAQTQPPTLQPRTDINSSTHQSPHRPRATHSIETVTTPPGRTSFHPFTGPTRNDPLSPPSPGTWPAPPTA